MPMQSPQATEQSSACPSMARIPLCGFGLLVGGEGEGAAAPASLYAPRLPSFSLLDSWMANELLPPYRDATQPVESRVRDLLSRMTLREKAAQMTQIERRVASPSALSGLPVGSVLSAGGSAPRERASPRDWADMIDRMQHWALASRLGIPILYASDAVHGHNNLYGATIFPHNVALGAIRSSTPSLLLHGNVLVL
ncbi:hypothetical protein GW17_00012061 [Ensete ventricosum]|nr:hypothetical protein GW17_00012061 [Ensete ventricosum]